MPLRLQRIDRGESELLIEIDRLPFIIGRRSDSHCALALASVSRHHCRFTQDGEQVAVQDLESFNGTFVNGKRALTPLPLQHGDELSLGPLQFRVLMGEAGPETQPQVDGTRGDASSPTRTDAASAEGEKPA